MAARMATRAPVRAPVRPARPNESAQYSKRLNAVVSAASRARKALTAELAKLDLKTDASLARIARVAWRCAEV